MVRLRAGALVFTAFATVACRTAPVDRARPGAARVELLDGRLALAPPKTARVEPRPHSIMAADASTAEESRVILVPGDDLAHFVLFATETFATLPDDAAARRAAIGPWVGADAALAEVALADGGTAIEYVTARPPAGGPLLIYGALVPMPDATVVELDYYILPEDAGARAAWVTQARAITRTVTRGQRGLERAARTVAFEGVELDAPADTALTAQPGPDFAIYRLRAIGPLGQPGAVVGLYFGGHPSYQHEQTEVASAAVAIEPGTLLGQAIEWHRWVDGQVEIREAIVARGDHDAIHVFRLAPVGDPRAAALDAALATLRVAPTSTGP